MIEMYKDINNKDSTDTAFHDQNCTVCQLLSLHTQENIRNYDQISKSQPCHKYQPPVQQSKSSRPTVGNQSDKESTTPSGNSEMYTNLHLKAVLVLRHVPPFRQWH